MIFDIATNAPTSSELAAESKKLEIEVARRELCSQHCWWLVSR